MLNQLERSDMERKNYILRATIVHIELWLGCQHQDIVINYT